MERRVSCSSEKMQMPMSRGRKALTHHARRERACGLEGWPNSEEGGAELKRMGFLAALTRRLGSEEGATAVEYALMVALIALVIVLAVTFLGQSTSSVYNNGDLVNALT
jgi:pilus assembly protein Flp/PilA